MTARKSSTIIIESGSALRKKSDNLPFCQRSQWHPQRKLFRFQGKSRLLLNQNVKS